MANLFKKAASLPQASTPAKADKKEQVTLPGLQQLAEIDALMKTLSVS